MRVHTWENAGRSSDVARESDHDGNDVAEAQSDQQQLADRRRSVAMRRRWVARKASGAASSAASIPEGGGVPLDGKARRGMEKHLGADLSHVRVHTGGESAEAASGFGARAFTVGSDVHFNKGEFAPGSKEGDRLLAHELTHVVQGQKSGGAVQRKAQPEGEAGGAEGAEHEGAEGGAEVSSPGEPAEMEADAKGDEVADKLHGDEKGGEEKKGGQNGKKKGKGAKGGHDAKGGGEEKGDAKEGGHDDAKGGGGEEKGGDEGAKGGDVKEAAAAPISAKLEGGGVARKIFLAKAPGAAGGPAAKPAAGAAPGAAGKPAAPAKSPDETNAEKRCKDALAAIGVDAQNKDLPSRLKYWGDELKPVRAKFPDNAALKEVDTAMKAKQTEVDAACTAAMTASSGQIDKLAKAPESWAAETALWTNPDSQRWMAAYPESAAVKAFKASHEKKQAELVAERTRVCKDAKDKLMAVPVTPDPKAPGADPRGPVDAAFESARGWMGKNIPDNSSETALQTAYVSKIETISAAKEKAAQEAAAKEKDKEKEKNAAPAAAPAAPAAPAAHGPAPAEHAPAPPVPAAHSEAAPVTTPQSATATPIAPASPTGAPVTDPAKDKEKIELEAKKTELKTRLMLAQGKTNALMGAAGTSISVLGVLHLTMAAAGLPGIIVACGVKVGIGITKFMKQKDTKLAVAEIDKIESIHEIETMITVAQELGDEVSALKNMLLDHKKQREEEEALKKAMGADPAAAAAAPAGGGKARPAKSGGEKAMHAIGKGVGVGEKVEGGGDVAATGMETAVHVGGEAIKEGAKHAMEVAVPIIETCGLVFSVLATGFELVELKHLSHEHHEAAEKLEEIENAKGAAAGPASAPAAPKA